MRGLVGERGLGIPARWERYLGHMTQVHVIKRHTMTQFRCKEKNLKVEVTGVSSRMA
jgi:hypothetical protein